MPPSLADALVMASTACLMTGSIWVKSWRMFFRESSNSDPSAACISSSTSTVGSNALVSISEAKWISWRARYFCAMMWAWYSMLADDATRDESSTI